MKSIGKSKGPATLGRVPRAHLRMQSGLGVIPQFNPDFRALDPGDGNELIAYEETDPGIMRLRRTLERDLTVARSTFRTLRNMKVKEWKRAVLDEKRAIVNRLKADILAKRVKYTYAEITVDPVCLGDPLSEVAIVNLWKTVNYGGMLRHRSLQGPVDFQTLFHCSKYKVNQTFVRAQLAPDGSITRHHDTIPRDATGKIWWYLDPHHVDEKFVVGWYRHTQRLRRLTAKETRKITRNLEKSRYSLVLRDAGWIEWLDAHPRPDRGNDAELLKLWTNIQKLERELSQAIRFQRCTHTKVEFQAQHAFETSADVPFSFGVDYADGELPVYNPWRLSSDPSSDRRMIQELVFPAFGRDWENTSCNRWVRTIMDPQGHIEYTTLGKLVKDGGNFIDVTGCLDKAQMLSSVKSKTVRPATFDNDYPPPKIIPEWNRSQILTSCLRQATKIEGLVFGRESADRLARSITECKDLPQMVGQSGEFLRWLASGLPLVASGMPELRGGALAKVLAAKTSRAAAAAWLFWKFGVEPTAHDVNNLCRGIGNYLTPMRAGLTSMYRSLENIEWDMTFKMKHKWKSEGVVGVQPTSFTRTAWIHLPCLPLVNSSSSPWPDGFRQDAGLVSLPERTKVCTDTYAGPVATCANGCVILSEMANGQISQSDCDANAEWLEAQMQEILFPVCTSTSWKTLVTNVFARFNADDIKAAYGWNGGLLSEVFGIHRALTTSWEVLPLSFIADWFLSTRQVMDHLNLQMFLRTEGLHLQPLDGVWLGHKFQYWNTVQWPHASVQAAYVGTFEGLEAHGIPGLPESWRGRTLTYRISSAFDAGYPRGGGRVEYSEKELSALRSWWDGPVYDPDPYNESHYPWYTSNSWIETHLPILSLKVAVTAAETSPSAVCGKGTCYQRYKIDEALRPLAVLPTVDMKVNAGKLISLAAIIANLVTVPKGAGKIRFSPVARFVRPNQLTRV